eukprot:6203209-Pleurochrysis_carterae.AAC.6
MDARACKRACVYAQASATIVACVRPLACEASAYSDAARRVLEGDVVERQPALRQQRRLRRSTTLTVSITWRFLDFETSVRAPLLSQARASAGLPRTQPHVHPHEASRQATTRYRSRTGTRTTHAKLLRSNGAGGAPRSGFSLAATKMGKYHSKLAQTLYPGSKAPLSRCFKALRWRKKTPSSQLV